MPAYAAPIVFGSGTPGFSGAPQCFDVLAADPAPIERLRTAQAVAQVLAAAADLKELTDTIGHIEVLVGGEHAEIVAELREYAVSEAVSWALQKAFKRQLRAYKNSFTALQTLPDDLEAAMEAQDEARVAKLSRDAQLATMRVGGLLQTIWKLAKKVDSDNEFVKSTGRLVKALLKDQKTFKRVNMACKHQ